MIWAFQPTPHDIWDYDAVNENILVDLPIGGTTRKVLVHFDRNGFAYTMDRATGEVLLAKPFVPMNWSSGVDLTTGRPNVNVDKATAQGKNVKDICPSLEGGKNQQPAAFSPKTGLFYVPTNNLCMDFEGREVTYIAGTPYIGGNAPEKGGPGGYKGEFMAWDAVNGRKVWGIKEPFPVWGGALATAGERRLLRNARRLVQGGGCAQRHGALSVQGRLGRRRQSDRPTPDRTASSTSRSTRASAAIWDCSSPATSRRICRTTSASAARRCPIWRATRRGAECCSCFHSELSDFACEFPNRCAVPLAIVVLSAVAYRLANATQHAPGPPRGPGTQATYFVEHPDHIQPGLAFHGRWATLENPYAGNAAAASPKAPSCSSRTTAWTVTAPTAPARWGRVSRTDRWHFGGTAGRGLPVDLRRAARRNAVVGRPHRRRSDLAARRVCADALEGPLGDDGEFHGQDGGPRRSLTHFETCAPPRSRITDPTVRVARFSLLWVAAYAIACSDASAPGRGVPATVEIVSGNGQTGVVGAELSSPIVIRVRDDRGHSAPNASVHIDATAAGSSVESADLVTNDSGLVYVRWTLGTVAQKQQLAIRLTQATASVVVDATANPGSATALRVTNSPLSTTRNGEALAQAPTVAVVDRFGNPTVGPSLVVTASLAPSTAKRLVRGTTSATTNGAGVATFAGLVVAGDTGTVTLLFSTQGLTAGSGTFVLTPGPPSRIDLIGGPVVSATVFDNGPPVQVRVVDESGNGLSGIDVQFTFPTVTGPVTARSNASGVATFTGWILPPTAGSYSIIAAVIGIPNLVINVTARPRPPSKLAALTTTTIAGNAGDAVADIAVQATDPVGNLVGGITVSFALDGAPLKDVVTDGSGIATLSGWKLPSLPNAYRITATVTGLPSVAFDVTVSIGPPSRLDVLSFPINPQVSTTAQITVRVTDAAGNLIPHSPVQWQALTAGVTVSPASTTSDDAAIITVTATFSTVATTVRIRASLAGGTAHDFSYTLTPGPMVAFETPIVFLTQAVNSRFTVTVRGIDQWGNPVPGVQISSYVDFGSLYAPLAPATTFTDGTGRAVLSGVAGATPGLEQFYLYGGNYGAMATVRVTVF